MHVFNNPLIEWYNWSAFRKKRKDYVRIDFWRYLSITNACIKHKFGYSNRFFPHLIFGLNFCTTITTKAMRILTTTYASMWSNVDVVCRYVRRSRCCSNVLNRMWTSRHVRRGLTCSVLIMLLCGKFESPFSFLLIRLLCLSW